MHGGLTASFEKLILDAERPGIMRAWFRPIPVTVKAPESFVARRKAEGGAP